MPIWNILLTFVMLNDRLVHFVFFWYFFPVLVSCTKKNLATLHWKFNFEIKSDLKKRLREGTYKLILLLCKVAFTQDTKFASCDAAL
jgi:hypothetical protein